MDERARERSEPARVAVVTVLGGAEGSIDASADVVKRMLREFGHDIVREDRVDQEQQEVQRVLREALEDRGVDSIILVGGTGLSKTDVTLEAVGPFQEKMLPGFGELLRRLSYEDVHTASISIRSMAFVSEGKVVFCIPDSEQIAGLATGRLIAPELGRLLSESRRGG